MSGGGTPIPSESTSWETNTTERIGPKWTPSTPTSRDSFQGSMFIFLTQDMLMHAA